MVNEEEWFGDNNLAVGATFPIPQTKRAKTRFNKKIKFPRDTKPHIW